MRTRVCVYVCAYTCVRAGEITSNRTAMAPPPRTFPAQSPALPGSPLLKPFPGQKSRLREKVISRIAQKASRSLSVAFLASRRVKIWVDAPSARNGLLARLRGHGAGAGWCSQVSLPSARVKTLCHHRFRGHDGASGTRRWGGVLQPSLAAFGPRQNLVSPSISRSFTFLPVPPSLSAKRATREIGAHGGFAASLATLHTPSRASPPRA